MDYLRHESRIWGNKNLRKDLFAYKEKQNQNDRSSYHQSLEMYVIDKTDDVEIYTDENYKKATYV